MSDHLDPGIEAIADPAAGRPCAAISPVAGSLNGQSGKAQHHSQAPAGSRASQPFQALLTRTIELLDARIDRDQLLALANASAVIGWEFPDLEWRTWLVVEREPPRIGLAPAATGPSSLTVVMDSTVLHEAAAGTTTLGMAFIRGRLQIRGMNPLFLARFVRLVDPLLAGYRAAFEELADGVKQ